MSRSFGPYEVLARLASGGAAHVFLARQPGAADFRKLVCLKMLLPERAADADFVAMFMDEARLTTQLNHPNCVQIYDLGQVDGRYYISMEYIFGETLWGLLTTVPRTKRLLPPEAVAAIIASAADGLHHAHELSDLDGSPFHLVHRDVSPQNIMVSFEGQTKVLDFGIAKAATGRAPTVVGVVKGKFSYMSPEQISGGRLDRRSDVFSLGILLFECLTARRLYRAPTPAEVASLILDHQPPRLRELLPDAPRALDEICARALSLEPEDRFASTAEMADALRDFLSHRDFEEASSLVATLMQERFAPQLAVRRRAYVAAIGGRIDDLELCEALGAKPVETEDLYPPPPDSSPGEEAYLPESAGPTAVAPVEAGGAVEGERTDLEGSAEAPATARSGSAAGEPVRATSVTQAPAGGARVGGAAVAGHIGGADALQESSVEATDESEFTRVDDGPIERFDEEEPATRILSTPGMEDEGPPTMDEALGVAVLALDGEVSESTLDRPASVPDPAAAPREAEPDRATQLAPPPSEPQPGEVSTQLATPPSGVPGPRSSLPVEPSDFAPPPGQPLARLKPAQQPLGSAGDSAPQSASELTRPPPLPLPAPPAGSAGIGPLGVGLIGLICFAAGLLLGLAL